MATGEAGERRSYLVEFQTIGSSVKVSALDPETLVEVSIVGPASASEAELSRLAVQKLKYRLRKQSEQTDYRPGIKA